jgi:hypothetical protein
VGFELRILFVFVQNPFSSREAHRKGGRGRYDRVAMQLKIRMNSNRHSCHKENGMDEKGGGVTPLGLTSCYCWLIFNHLTIKYFLLSSSILHSLEKL